MGKPMVTLCRMSRLAESLGYNYGALIEELMPQTSNEE